MAEENFKDTIQLIKDRNPIEDVMAEYTELKGQGDRLVGSCPMPDHRDSTPSMMVDVQNQNCFCFGCGASGDVIKVVMEIENVDFVRSLEILADRAGVELDLKNDDFRSQKLRETYDVLERTNKALNKVLKMDRFPDGLKYLREERDIDDVTIDRFGLGYNPGWFNGAPFMANLKSMRDDSKLILKEIGFISDSKRENSNHPEFDAFSNRVTIPVRDMRGHICGFTGRTLKELTPSGDKIAKYKNSYDSYVFDKSKMLLGLYESLNIINDIQAKRKLDSILMIEGGFDVITCLKHNIHACAPLGTALTESQAKMVWRYTDEVVICMDNDMAGAEATMRSISTLLSTQPKGKSLKVMQLTVGKDPDEAIRTAGVGIFKEDMRRSQNAVDFVVNHFSRVDPHNRQDVMRMCNDVSDYLSTIRNRLAVQSIRHFVAKEVGISENMIEITEPVTAKAFPVKPVKQAEPETNEMSLSVMHAIALLHTKPILSKFIDENALHHLNSINDKGFNYFKEILSIYINEHNIPPQMSISRYFASPVYKELMQTIDKVSELSSYPTKEISGMLNDILNEMYIGSKQFNKSQIDSIHEKYIAAEPLTDEEKKVWKEYHSNLNNSKVSHEPIDFLKKPEKLKEVTHEPTENRRPEDGASGVSLSR